MSRARSQRGRRGSAYLLVLTVSTIVAAVGLAAMAAARLAVRTASTRGDALRAETLALAAAERAVTIMQTVPTWRTDHVHDDPSPAETPFGGGFVSHRFVDLSGDDDLAAGDGDAVRIYGIGRVGEAVRVHSVKAVSAAAVPDALSVPVHAAGNIEISKPMTVVGGPLSTNQTLSMWGGPLNADVEALAVTGSGTVNGTITAPAPPKSMPPASVISFYQTQAVSIDHASLPLNATGAREMSGGVLSGSSNPWGAISPPGVYLIDVPDAGRLDIDGFRLEGTLIILGGTAADVSFEADVHAAPDRSDYPTIILSAGPSSIVTFKGNSSLLSIDPAYQTEMRGLIHVIGDQTMVMIGPSYQLFGALITEGRLERGSGPTTPTIAYDASLGTNPPLGYGGGAAGMTVVAGSWRWEPNE